MRHQRTGHFSVKSAGQNRYSLVVRPTGPNIRSPLPTIAMNRHFLWVLIVSFGSFAGGISASLLLDPRAAVVAQSGSPLPAPPVPEREVAVGPEQFDRIVTQIAPTVVAVDAVKAAPQTGRREREKTEEESGSGVIVRFEGRPVELEVTTSSVQNPLRLDALRSFRCPGRL